MQITFNPSIVKVKEMRRLEKLRGFSEMADWFAKNCGVPEAEFDELTLTELQQASAELQEKVKSAMTLPKVSAAN